MNARALAILAAAATGILVGAAMVSTRTVSTATSPVTLAFLRYLIGVAMLGIPVLLAHRTRFAWRDAIAVAGLGILQFAVLIVLLNIALGSLSAATCALIFSTMPLLTLCLSVGLGRERFSLARLAGLLLAVAGVAVLLRATLQQETTAIDDWTALAALIGATLIGAVCSMLYRPYVQRYAALPTSALAMLAAVVFLLGLCLATGQPLAPALTPLQWANVAFIGLASGVGMVVGPALAALLAQHSLSLPLYLTGVLPIVAFIILWRALPRTPPVQHPQRAALKLNDLRLRRPMAVAFTAMFCVAIAQITVGFFAIDRLGLVGPAAAKAAGIALTAVGVSLVLSQMLVRKLKWQPQRMIYVGGLVSAVGFGAVALAESAPVLWACYFVAAAGMGWVFPAFSALAANAVEPHEQGAAAGTVGAAQGLGIVVGPLVGTVLYGVSPGTPYLLVGAMLAAVALWPTTSEKKG